MRWFGLRSPLPCAWQGTRATSVPASEATVFDSSGERDWYDPVLVSPGALGAAATAPDTLRRVIQIVRQLEPDEYVRYLLAYYENGLSRFGGYWRYADVVTALAAVAQLCCPKSYLEIGVRRGRSMAVVAALAPECDIVGFDCWARDYAGMPNPGPDLVRSEMQKVHHRGTLDLVSGDSHVTLPSYLREHPDAFFDLVTVDGDHAERGAQQDLSDVLPRLKLGGVLVFDDIRHPALPHLGRVWQRIVVADSRYATWEFTELGYGVALAVRRTA